MLSSLSWCGLPMAAAPWWYMYHSGMVGLHSHVSISHCLWIQMYIHLSWAVSSSSLVAVFSFVVYITYRTSETSLDGYRLIHDMIPPQPCSLPHASYSCLLLLQFYAPNMLAYQYKDQAPTKNKVQGDKEPKYMLDKICHFQIAQIESTIIFSCVLCLYFSTWDCNTSPDCDPHCHLLRSQRLKESSTITGDYSYLVNWANSSTQHISRLTVKYLHRISACFLEHQVRESTKCKASLAMICYFCYILLLYSEFKNGTLTEAFLFLDSK